ncbi:MAG: EAL domain-containing protein [Gammaproteobacteria bacterium]|nr:EAL domain-containing protein [Gammaproteobacteria bacterium]
MQKHSNEIILVVDDTPTNLETMEVVLKRPDWEIVTVDSGDAALSWLLKKPEVSLILMDVQMPAMNGFEVACMIRQNISFQSVPIIFISAMHSSDDYISYGFTVGASDYLIKPVDNSILIQRIELFLKLYRKQCELEKLSHQLRQRYETLMLSMSEAVLLVNREGNITSSNEAAQLLSGYDTNELNSMPVEALIPEAQRQQHQSHRQAFHQKPHSKKVRGARELTCLHKNGSVIPVEISLNTDNTDKDSLITVILQDISERKILQEQLLHKATHDELTGLLNRTVLFDRINQGLDYANRDHKLLAVLFLDLDRFKFVNDSLGHNAGDQLLKMATVRLQQQLRAIDTLIRYGGDEFVIITVVNKDHDVTHIIDKLISVFTKNFLVDGHDIDIGLSIGVCIAKENQPPESILHQADSAMYEVKKNGRGSFHIFSKELNARIEQRMKLEMNMQNALIHQEYELYYQPKISPYNNEIIGLEALIRWNSSEHGLIFPNEFIPLAEENDFIITLGNWVIKTASDQALKWQQAGLLKDRIAINVSGVQLASDGFICLLRHQVKYQLIHPELLEIELTETATLKHPKEAKIFLEELKSMGFKLALDDFGTGFSSLTWLAEFPYDTVKIDRSFISKALDDEKHLAIVSSSIQLAKSIGMKTVAEGVETQQQLNLLTKMGCDLIQGYFYSKPLPIDEIEQWTHEI